MFNLTLLHAQRRIKTACLSCPNAGGRAGPMLLTIDVKKNINTTLLHLGECLITE